MPDPVEAEHDANRLDPLIWKIGSVAAFGSFLSQLDATVVNVSLSSLAAAFHSSLSAIHWVTSGYLLALALMLPLSGWLVDRIGARVLYLWSFSAFTLTSALCGFAWSANSLIGFRILQGMSGGLMAPMAQMMMARTAGKHMAGVLGFAAMPILLAPFLGWRLASAHSPAAMQGAFTAAFILLCTFHGLLIAAAIRLPLSVEDGPKQSPAIVPILPAVLGKCERANEN